MRTVIALFLIVIAQSCEQKTNKIEIIKFSDLENIILNSHSDYLVLNFWATWCAPCVKELPQFDQLLSRHQENGLEVILVSFDFVEQLEKKVSPFVERKKIKSEVVLLDETDYNSFIDKIDPGWSGAIPATLMINKRTGKRVFFEKEFKEGELENAFNSVMN
ncbi:TlpA disulfide reductase family protein [Reichenbachiella sp. MALMAid0571]|uniref:TlpA disulfide reductase family protein n=1 Tax=Reichenbachiella sp. MALMAid0571 TaxID=3143939 RepID=UPI0032DED3EB